MSVEAINRQAIGGNNPPEPTPYEKVKDRIEGLYLEASNWLDGDPIDSQESADAVSNLLGMIRDAKNEAEEYRKAENKPFDEGKAEVQARYNVLIGDTKAVQGKTVLASDACKKALQPWLKKLDAEQRAREAEAKRIADEAEAAAREAAAKADTANLADIEAREAAIEKAKQSSITARQAEKAKPQSGGGFGKRVGLRSTFVPVITDMREAAGHYWKTNRKDFEEFLLKLAKEDVARGKRDIPGFTINEERNVV